jgi:DNA-binding NarL/FixJ family response regulator
VNNCGEKDGPVVRLVVADAHRLMQDALAAQLEPEGFEIVGQACKGSQVMPLVAATRPDALLTESDLPELDGIAVISRLRRTFPRVVPIVFAADNRRAQIERALDAGAHGFISKAIDPRALGAEIRRVLEQPTRIPIGLPAAPQPQGVAANLTSREMAILQLVAEGGSNVQIGRQTFVTEQTVKFHLTNIYRKIGVSNRTEAALFARRHGLLELQEQVA